MAALEAMMLAATIGSGLYFTGVFVRDLPHDGALGLAALGAVLSVSFVAVLRRVVPANVGADEPEPEDDTDDEGGWDVGNAVLAAIVVPLFFVVQVLVRQWPLLLVVAAMSVGAESASAWGVVVAVSFSLVVLLVLEVAVVWPLSRRWGLPLD